MGVVFNLITKCTFKHLPDYICFFFFFYNIYFFVRFHRLCKCTFFRCRLFCFVQLFTVYQFVCFFPTSCVDIHIKHLFWFLFKTTKIAYIIVNFAVGIAFTWIWIAHNHSLSLSFFLLLWDSERKKIFLKFVTLRQWYGVISCTKLNIRCFLWVFRGWYRLQSHHLILYGKILRFTFNKRKQ